MIPRRIGWFCVAFLLIGVSTAHAIPAFARRYRISCSTCHDPFPRLKPYGEEFAGHGMILKEEEKERDYITAGDALLWLNRDFPIAVRLDAFGIYEPKASEVRSDFQTPWGLKLLSGGTLTRHVGYYFYFYLSERGEVAGIEDAYLHFDDLFGTPLDLLVGQFQASDPLMKRELRLTYEDYQIYRTRIGDSPINLTYDRGIMAIYPIDKTGTELVAMVLNGNGKGQADETTRRYDSDSYKNVACRLAQDIGSRVRIGGFYYLGRERVQGLKSRVVYFGPDVSLQVGPLALTGQYLIREDSRVSIDGSFPDPPGPFRTRGGLIEAVYAPRLDRSRWYLVALYNRVDSGASDLLMDGSYDYETAALSWTFLVSRNLRLTWEYLHDFQARKDRLVVGVVSAF